MRNLCEQATISAKQRVEKLGSSAEPIKLQRLLATLSLHSPVGCGPFIKHTFEKAQMRCLKGAVKLTALLHESCSPDLASIHTGGDSVTFSKPNESMWPVIYKKKRPSMSAWLIKSLSLFELLEGERKSWRCLTCRFAKSALGQSKRTCSSSCTQYQLHLVQIVSS